MYKKVLCSLLVLVLGSTYAFADGVKIRTNTGSYGTRDDGGSAERKLCVGKKAHDKCTPKNAPKDSGECIPNQDKNGAGLSCAARECNDGYVLWLTNKRKDPGNLFASQGRCDSIEEIDAECATKKHTGCGEGESYKIKTVVYKSKNGKFVNGYVGQDSCNCYKETELEFENKVGVVYNCGGGEGEPPVDTEKYDVLNASFVHVKYNTCNPQEGFKFANWKCGSKIVPAGGSFVITGDTTCTAQWEELPKPEPEPVIANGGGEPEETLSVVYDCSGGGGAIPTDEKKYKSGDTVTTLSNSCEKDGSDFLSWLCGEEQVGAQGTFTITDNTTCSAIWNDVTVEEESIDPDPTINPEPTIDPNPTINPNPTTDPNPTIDPDLDRKRAKAHNMVSGLSTAATGIGAMEMAQAISEKKADEEAERDMKAYLETMRCNYQKGPEYKYSTEDILLPGGNELLAYYTEYKNLAEEVKAAKTALGMKPGIETEVVYDKAQSGLYHYENIGKTGGAYASLSNALLDANSEDAAAWDAEKDKTKKRLIAGATVAGVGAVGGFVGDKLVDKHFDKLENQQISGNTQTQVVTSSYKYEWTEETEEVLERNGITITREEFYEKINDPEFIGTLVGLLGASKGQ